MFLECFDQWNKNVAGSTWYTRLGLGRRSPPWPRWLRAAAGLMVGYRGIVRRLQTVSRRYPYPRSGEEEGGGGVGVPTAIESEEWG